MSQRITITPTGRLAVEADEEQLPQVDSATESELRQAFDTSAAAGLYYLASSLLGRELPASLVFFRQFASRLFHDLCNLSEESLAQVNLKSAQVVLPPPGEAELATLI